MTLTILDLRTNISFTQKRTKLSGTYFAIIVGILFYK